MADNNSPDAPTATVSGSENDKYLLRQHRLNWLISRGKERIAVYDNKTYSPGKTVDSSDEEDLQAAADQVVPS